MADGEQLNVRAKPKIHAELKKIKRETGLPIQAQVELALKEWLERRKQARSIAG